MRLFKTVLLATIFGFALTSCGDSDDIAPVVTITSPAAGTSFTIADTIVLTGTVIDETELSVVRITSDLGLNESITELTTSTTFDLNATLTLDSTTVAGSYTITVEGEDEEGNVGTDSVVITVQ